MYVLPLSSFFFGIKVSSDADVFVKISILDIVFGLAAADGALSNLIL
jgi:hypothetical protein